MEKIKIGTIVNAVGLKGEVKVYHFSDYKERFEELDEIIVSGTKGERSLSAKKDAAKGGGKSAQKDVIYKIQGVRYQKDMAILKLKGVDDRNAAEALKERDVFITEADLRELPEDTFYVRDLIGCDVINQQTGAVIGRMKDVIQNTAQDIYQVTLTSGKEALVPAVAQFVAEVDIEARKVVINPIPGLIDDEGVQLQGDKDEN